MEKLSNDCANVSANPVTELLAYLCGWNIQRELNNAKTSVGIFSSGQIYSKRGALTRNIELARHWEPLPTKAVWSSVAGVGKGSLELVSVSLDAN